MSNNQKILMPQWLNDNSSYIWPPYAKLQDYQPIAIIGAEGSYLHLANGQKIIDGIASWWTMAHGYNNHHISKNIAKQLETLPHIMFAGIAHEPAYILAGMLAKLYDGKVFFSDSGSVAVEIAMKMTIQFWLNNKVSGKNKFVAFTNSYHGDTMAAMSVSGSENFNAIFHKYIPSQHLVTLPQNDDELNIFADFIKNHKNEIAGLIIEPLVQCAGGFHIHSPLILKAIFNICTEHEIIFIADEIATGFYRTGSVFAFKEANIIPDIICIGKALSGGFLPIAATIASPNITQAFESNNSDKILMHGPTFMANPLACAASIASLELFAQSNYSDKALNIENIFKKHLLGFKNPIVTDIRIKGAIAAIEAHFSQANIAYIQKRAIELGAWIRPFDKYLYLMPPLTISEYELIALCDISKNVINEI
jgi:adenosylmethionine---8-amino-7-oxononanoate aminotransferase